MNTLNLSADHLRRAATIRDEIDRLSAELAGILGGTRPPAHKKRGTMSAAGRARIAAAQRARWAKVKGKKTSSNDHKPKRRFSAAARAKIAAAAKARWAKAKAQGKTSL